MPAGWPAATRIWLAGSTLEPRCPSQPLCCQRWFFPRSSADGLFAPPDAVAHGGHPARFLVVARSRRRSSRSMHGGVSTNSSSTVRNSRRHPARLWKDNPAHHRAEHESARSPRLAAHRGAHAPPERLPVTWLAAVRLFILCGIACRRPDRDGKPSATTNWPADTTQLGMRANEPRPAAECAPAWTARRGRASETGHGLVSAARSRGVLVMVRLQVGPSRSRLPPSSMSWTCRRALDPAQWLVERRYACSPRWCGRR